MCNALDNDNKHLIPYIPRHAKKKIRFFVHMRRICPGTAGTASGHVSMAAPYDTCSRFARAIGLKPDTPVLWRFLLCRYAP